MKAKDLRLCPDCPLTKCYRDEAYRRIRERQVIKADEDPSALKVCMERRKILSELGLSCPYFGYGFGVRPQPQRIKQTQTTLH